ncbi:MAG: hypothetical protein P8Q40_04520 [Candidatus Poseidonia sp.]|uniref:hypothetical protein n=1 Tax=Poseidonia sp. TaxID=2666344 RepID=UPI0030C1632D|nr:hypothetical protein [Poseidonia sp.]
MRPPRPRAFAGSGAVRLTLTALLAVHVFISAWLVATVEASYTEGRPAPTEFHSLVAIDNEQTLIDVRIERATSFVLYTLQRDDSATVPVNSSDSDNTTAVDDSAEGEDAAPEGSERDWLKFGRDFIKISLVILVMSELVMMVSWKWRHYLRAFAFALTLVAFTAFPLCYVASLGEGSDGDSKAGSAPGAELETQSFAHAEDSFGIKPIWLGFELQADFSGYDLGLVDEEDRAGVIAQPPEENETGAKSFVAFESTFNIELGKNLDALLVLPLMWYFLPARPINHEKKTYETLLEEE